MEGWGHINVTKLSRTNTDLGRLLLTSRRVAFSSRSTPPRPVFRLSARRGRKRFGFVTSSNGNLSRRPTSVPLRCIGGTTGFQRASRPPHHSTRIARNSTSTNPNLMHYPHQELDRRERLSLETLGLGSPAFCDMPFSIERGSSHKPSVLVSIYLEYTHF